MRGRDVVDASVAVEDRVVLVGEVVERRGDGERNHDRIDAGGTNRQRAAERAEDRRKGERHRGREPPGPAQADIGMAADAKDRVHVAREAGDGELHQADHAAIACQEHQAECDDPEDHGGAEDLDQEEAIRNQRHDQEDQCDDPGCRIVEFRP